MLGKLNDIIPPPATDHEHLSVRSTGTGHRLHRATMRSCDATDHGRQTRMQLATLMMVNLSPLCNCMANVNAVHNGAAGGGWCAAYKRVSLAMNAPTRETRI